MSCTPSLAILLVCGLICSSYLVGSTTAAASGETVPKSAGALKQGSLITISEDDWEQLLTGEWMVEFHAPWCPACRALQPEWKSFAAWSAELGIKVGAVDVTANPGLSGRFLVTALPTIYHVSNGVFRQYKGTRDVNTFVAFIEDKKWQSIEPVTSWKSPDSVQMSFVSYLFKISMALRSVHNSLVEDYGIPYWGSYIVFAFATILFGAILGLLIVCVIDLIWPSKLPEVPYKQVQKTQQKASSSEEDEDEEDDNIEDDEDIEDESGDEKASGAEEQSPPVSQSDEPSTDEDQAAANSRGLRKRRARKD